MSLRPTVGRACRTAWVALFVVGAMRCGPARGYEAPQSPVRYSFLLLERDSLSLGIEGALAADGLRVSDAYRGGERAAATVMVYPFENRLHIRVADTRTGLVLIALAVDPAELPADSLGASRALGDLLVQAIRRAP